MADIDGSTDADSLEGSAGSDSIRGFEGNDTLVGHGGADTLLGGAGNDVLEALDGSDSLVGGTGNDEYRIDTDDSVVAEAAGEGTDSVYVLVTDDWLTPVVSYQLGEHVEKLFYDVDYDTGVSFAGFTGTGNDADNYISAVGDRATDDTLDGGLGADTLLGGKGDDLYFTDDTGDVVYETGNAAAGGNDTVKAVENYGLYDGIENLILLGTRDIDATGNALDNRLSGNSNINLLRGLDGDDRLAGKAGGDTLAGGNGNDTLEGGSGNDLLTGNAGSDRFLFNSTPSGAKNLDHIRDFVAGTDRIVLDNDVFAGLGAVGTLKSGAFVAGRVAQDAGDRILYDQSTGILYYDRDGTGALAKVAFADLDNSPALSASAFLVA